MSRVFKKGESIKMGDLTLIINAVQDNVNSGNQFIQPASGNRYFAVDVKVTYEGSVGEYLNPFDFKIKDSGDYAYDANLLSAKAPELKSKNLSTGESLRGWITFEIPKGSKGLKLIYTPNFWDSSEIVVTL